MSPQIVPAEGEELTLYQGRTFLPTWVLYDVYVAEGDPANEPTDLTGWHAYFTITGKDRATVKQLTDATGVLPTTDAQGTSGVVLDAYVDGGIAVVLTDEDAKLLNSDSFTQDSDEEGETIYTGRYDLTLQDAAGERFPFELGDVLFVPLPAIP
jgi:hypothetical protein